MEVINQMNKYTIINLKLKGYSNRMISKELGINRKTIGKLWHEYCEAQEKLKSQALSEQEREQLTLRIISGNRYDVSTRSRRKLTPSVESRIIDILENEDLKTKRLGLTHKQRLSCQQIYEILNHEGVDIGLTTVTNFIRRQRMKKEIFIRQDYALGQRAEFDFGEVKLMVRGKVITVTLAVFSAPASQYRWARLYQSQNQKVFLDAHVRFLNEVQGVYQEIVYDNMKNVVKRFGSKHEKELNPELLKMALYYGFDVNVTNCYSGHEKGTVENSVKVIRNKVFAQRYEFDDLNQANDFLTKQLQLLNETSQLEEEKYHLKPVGPPYEIAEFSIHRVDKYGCIQLETNYYSVPDYLIHHQVVVKNYPQHIIITCQNEIVCEHKKINGMKQFSLKLNHYLKTLSRKPGALNNALALKQIPQLHTIYQSYFKTNPREFIMLLIQNQHLPLESLIEKLQEPQITGLSSSQQSQDNLLFHSLNQLKQLSDLHTQGEPHDSVH